MNCFEISKNKNMWEGFKKKLLFRFSPEYERFVASSLELKKTIIRGFRVAISLVLVIFTIILFAFDEAILAQKIGYPALIVFNILLSSMLLRKRFEKYCSIYLGILSLIFLVVGIQLAFSKEKTAEQGVIFGFDVGLIFSVFLLTKLPFLYILTCSAIVTAQLLLITFASNSNTPYLSSISFIFLLLFANFVFYRQEGLEFAIWKDLQENMSSMQCFQELIHVFPCEILIIDEKSWASDKALYLNQEAKKRINEKQKELSIHKFLDKFKLERDAGQGEGLQQVESFSGELTRIISETFVCKKPSAEKYQKLIATLTLSPNIESFPSNIYKSEYTPRNSCLGIKFEPSLTVLGEGSKANLTYPANHNECISLIDPQETDEREGISKIKYELKVGTIKWGSEDAVIVILTDISLSEKIRDLNHLHENKDRLLATVSHELRTPLNGIIGMLDLVEDENTDLNARIKKYLTIARNSAKTLLLMINDILDISQIQKGKLRLNMTSAPLHSLIEEVLPLIEVQVKKKGLELLHSSTVPRGVNVQVDPIRFKQILLNLLSNACKFTETGNIKISAEEGDYENNELEASVEAKKSILISVTDTGRGIRRENISELFKLFGKFEQIGNSTGVGLGLAISQKLAQQMHPKGITASSVFGKGSSFSFNVYQCLGHEYEEGRSSSKTRHLSNKENYLRNLNSNKLREPKPLDSGGKIVLIVDDDQINHIVLSKYLYSLGGLTIHKAFNGLEAIKTIQSLSKQSVFFNIIFMDCNMPVMDGFEASKKIKNLIRDGLIPDLKIIALTANVSAADRKLCLESGMDDVWNKPLYKKDFMKLIAFHLNRT